MTLERIDRKTSLFPYPVYEQPMSYPYDARGVIERIFFLTDPDNIFKDTALSLFDKAVKSSEYLTKPLEIGAEAWGSANALINRIIGTEETRITDGASWQEFKKILLTTC